METQKRHCPFCPALRKIAQRGASADDSVFTGIASVSEYVIPDSDREKFGVSNT
jgi:hypothetical protein